MTINHENSSITFTIGGVVTTYLVCRAAIAVHDFCERKRNDELAKCKIENEAMKQTIRDLNKKLKKTESK